MRGRDAARALRLIADGSRETSAGEATCGAGVVACQDELGYLRAEALNLGGKVADAVAAYHALDRRGAPPAMRQNALYAAAQLERRQGRAAEARADYERALAAAPRGALHEEALVGAMESAQAAGDAARAECWRGVTSRNFRTGGRPRRRAGWPAAPPLRRTRRGLGWTLLLAAAIGCRREVELTLPRAVPMAACAPNAAACAGDGECCSAACREGRCVAAVCRVEGTPCQVRRRLLLVRLRPQSGRYRRAPVRKPRRMRLRRAVLRARGRLLRAGLQRGGVRGDGLRKRRGPVRERRRLLRRRVHGGDLHAAPGCRPAGEACAMSGDCCGLACLSVGETGGAMLPVAARVPRRRGRLRERRRLLQRALHEHAGRVAAGVRRCPAAAPRTRCA